MSICRQFARGVRALMNRSAADREVADEVDHYLQEATDSLIASGLPAEEARRAARLELGNTTAVREEEDLSALRLVSPQLAPRAARRNERTRAKSRAHHDRLAFASTPLIRSVRKFLLVLPPPLLL